MQRNFTIHSGPNFENETLKLRCDILDSSEIFNALALSDIRIIGNLSNSSNNALLGEINIDDESAFSVVIKPASFENPLIDFEWGTLAKREVAAFELSQLLGWGLVPATSLRDVQDLQCSVQLFIPHDPRQHYFNFKMDDRTIMEKFAIFDYIANNADRKAGHILQEVKSSFEFFPESEVETLEAGSGSFYGIDHGLTFHREDKLRTVIWEFTESPISEELLVPVEKALPKIEGALSNFISDVEIEALVLRIEQLLMNPYHRALDTNSRAFPWPLV